MSRSQDIPLPPSTLDTRLSTLDPELVPMTPRDRITSAVEFSCPDRIPVHWAIFPGAFFRHGQKLVDFLNAQPDDFGAGKIALPSCFSPHFRVSVLCLSGVWQSGFAPFGLFSHFRDSTPLATHHPDSPRLNPNLLQRFHNLVRHTMVLM